MPDDVIGDVPSFPGAGENRPGEVILNKVSWGAIWAAVMVTIGMEALFLSFGLLIGGALGGSTIWTMIWYLVTMAVSFYIGGWTAARFSNSVDRGTRVLHGLATWGLATLATVLIVGAVFWGTVRLGFALALNSVGPVMVTSSAVWHAIEMWAGMIFGGVLLGFITAYLGGASGIPGPRIRTRENIPLMPRRAA
jgi:hypothetical protein